jgi:hypothetical protein
VAAAWEAGWYYLKAGEAGTYWVSWDDTWQGLQFIATEPRGPGQAQVYVTSYGIQTVPQFGANPRVSYWVEAVNRGPSDVNFVLRGERVAD